jgi:elongation factor 1-gamma
VLDQGFRKEFKNLNRWFMTIAHVPQVAAVVGEVVMCVKATEPKYEEPAAAAAAHAPAAKKEQHPKKEEKPKPKKEEKPADDEDEDEEAEKKEKKPPNPLDQLPPSKLVMDAWKRTYSNEDTKTVAVPWFFENYDPAGYSIWFCRYKFEIEASQVFMVANSLSGFIQRLDPLRKYGFGSLIIFGEEKPFEVEGFWLFRGTEIPKEMTDCDDCELYTWTRADPAADKERITEFLTWEGAFSGKKFNQGKIFK